MKKVLPAFSVIFAFLFVFISLTSAQKKPTPLIEGTVIALIDSSSGPSFNAAYRGGNEMIFYEPNTGNMIVGWYYYYGSSDPDPRRIYAAVSSDNGMTWQIMENINMGVGTSMNARYPTVKGTADNPIIVYRNVANSDPNIQAQPTVATDLLGWGGGVWENIFIDENATSDSIMDVRYYSMDIAPDNPDLWLVGAYHSTDPPGEMLLAYRSEDRGVTWSQPIAVASAVSADTSRPNYIIDLSTSSLQVLLGANNKAFAVGLCQYYSDSDIWRLFYVTSEDGGKTWSKPSLIPGADFLEFSNADIYRNFTVLRDADNNFHVFAIGHDTSKVDEGEGYRAWHFRFDGTSWTINKFVSPYLIEDGLVAWGLNDVEESYPMNNAAVGPDGALYYAYIDVVDTTGSGGDPNNYSYRLFVMVSEDNGNTWKGPVAVLKDWSGRGPNGMARNASDMLHVVLREYDPDIATSLLYYVGIPTQGIMETDVKADPATLPEKYELFQNFPNPFNPSTTIRFNVKERTHVRLTVYNALGQKVTTLIDQIMDPGFKGISWDASGYPSGIYFYELKAGTLRKVKHMTLSK